MLHKFGLIAVVLLSLGMGYYFFGLWIPASRAALDSMGLGRGYGFGNDFYQVWLTSRELLSHHADAYSAEMQCQIEKGLYGRTLDRSLPGDASMPYRGDSYPLHASLFASPLATLPFSQVQIVLSVLLPLGATITVFCWYSVIGLESSGIGCATAILLGLTSVPVLEGIYALQVSLFVAALIGSSMALIQQGKLGMAGSLLALATVKPQLIILLVGWLTLWAASRWQERSRFVAGFGVSSFLLFAVSIVIQPNWLAGWVHSLHEYRRICPPPLAEFVLGRYLGSGVAVFLVLMAVRLAWQARHQEIGSENFIQATIFVLVTTVIVLPSTIAVYDQFLLLPAALWLYWRRSLIINGGLFVRVLALLTTAVLGWQWVAACALVIASWIAPQTEHFPGRLLLPLRTAASVPFAIMGILCFIVLDSARRGGRHSSTYFQSSLRLTVGD